ncbi:hypothetical protein B0H17DRAFT_1139515 [Mycena rosella]|uniref:Uncharacterized protein n=1 Tax=Mycena rosella TaxID=1033263 RepID=A0AAD7D411_MYCRO|nr:hypothetical protein B0H17DRAFT_1139515 [Mycena rosella]
MSSKFRCNVPFYGDPGQPSSPLPGQKIYLVTGRNVRAPGAYVSWPSAHAQYSRVLNASVKAYKDYMLLQAAWLAGCDRGEHAHPAYDPDVHGTTHAPTREGLSDFWGSSSTITSSPSPPRPPARSRKSPKSKKTSALTAASTATSISGPSDHAMGVRLHAVLPHPPPPPHPSSNPPTDPPKLSQQGRRHQARLEPLSHIGESDSVGIPGNMSYAVKGMAQGVVFHDYGLARDLYHQMQADGQNPTLASSPSLTEGEAPAAADEIERRQQWIREECAARRRHVAESWDGAMGRGAAIGGDSVWRSESNEADGWDSEALLLATEASSLSTEAS